MALDLTSLISMGFAVAKELVPDAFDSSTVRLGPTSAVDVVEDTAATTWLVELAGVSLFGFDDADERKALPVDTKQRSFLLEAADYPAGAPFSQTGQVETSDGVIWEVYRAEVAPGGGVVIFYGRA
jgi:hypothetical protein